MRNRPSPSLIIAVSLFIAACVLGVLSQRGQKEMGMVPRAQYVDATPLGGKGLRLMLGRLGYTTKLEGGILQSMPGDAKVWVLLDPHTGFSRNEARNLLSWVKAGGTLIWAATPSQVSMLTGNFTAWNNTGLAHLRSDLGVVEDKSFSPNIWMQTDQPLTPLAPLKQGAASDYWNGVKKAQGSGSGLEISRPHLEIAGSVVDIQLARIDYGKGRVFLAPDALMFTNYALDNPDNAVLVSNLIRAHVPTGGTVYFDERKHGETLEEKIDPNWLYYIWRPPLRYAVIQLLLAAILVAILYGRRLGAPVPLPDGGPVTRASHFALAMGALFQKVGRPKAAGVIIGDHFRRRLTRRLGLSIQDDDALIAQKAEEATGYPSRMLDRLLLQAKAPDDDEARTLSDAQEMEMILRKLEQRES